VITGAYPRIADRVARLVFLDAHAPVAPDTSQSPERVATAEAHGGMLPFELYDPDPAEVGGEAGVAWFMARVMPQSFATFAAPLGPPLPDHVDKTYVFATKNLPSRFERYAAATR